MNAVIYARYSSHAQREESIDGQLRECNEFAIKNNMTIIHEYCDSALTGKTDKRPQFQKMIKDAEKGRFEAVIMYTLDRFARNRYDSAIYKAKLKKNGVRVFYAKQPMPETPEGIILESVLEGYAEYYSENLSRNVKRGMKESALQGRVLGRTPPLGYIVGKDKKYHVDPIGAKVVQEIFQKYADGCSATSIINWCNNQGYKTAAGNRFNKNSLRSILQNEKYIGVYKDMGVIIENGVPSIVTKEVFEKVQEMCKHNKKAKARTKAKEDYLLTTKVFCGHCGSPMVGESGTSRTGKTHKYYKCACRKKNHKCNKKTEKKNWLEDFVVRYIVDTVLTDDNIDSIATQVIELLEKESADTTYVDSLKANLKDANGKIDNILKAIEDGIYSESVKSRLDELEETKKDIETQIAKEEIKKPMLSKEHIQAWLNSFKNGDINSIDYKRRIIDTLLNSVYVFDTPDGGRKLVLTFNQSGQNTATIKCSDISCFAAPGNAWRKTAHKALFFTKLSNPRCKPPGYFYNHY